jgi:rare lipoprotein A
MRKLLLLTAALMLACLLAAAPGMAKEAEATTGGASWYGPGLYGNSTASGEVLTPSTWGAAHNTLPFGTELTICYQGACANNVPVIDRGPYVAGRDLDVTAAVAETIGLTSAGVGLVTWHVEGRAGIAGEASAPASYRANDRASDRANDRANYRDIDPVSYKYASSQPDAGGGTYYVVRPGDTLSGIAAQFGTSVNHLASANGIPDPDFILVGQKIYTTDPGGARLF